MHLEAFRKLGINIEEKSGFIICKCDKIIGNDIHLDFPSVGATENIILASVLAEGTTTISNAAMEPEIIDLAECLNKMGGKITGAGTNFIKIEGVHKLKEIGYRIMPDRIEAGTFLCATAITGGKVKINNARSENLTPILYKLEECGCEIEIEKNSITITSPKKLKSTDIKTLPYPGFPTDMQSIFASILTISKGTSIIVENIFENRYKYVSELKKMGAKITIEDKTIIIKGTRKLTGTTVYSTDLRRRSSINYCRISSKRRNSNK